MKEIEGLEIKKDLVVISQPPIESQKKDVNEVPNVPSQPVIDMLVEELGIEVKDTPVVSLQTNHEEHKVVEEKETIPVPSIENHVELSEKVLIPIEKLSEIEA